MYDTDLFDINNVEHSKNVEHLINFIAIAKIIYSERQSLSEEKKHSIANIRTISSKAVEMQTTTAKERTMKNETSTGVQSFFLNYLP